MKAPPVISWFINPIDYSYKCIIKLSCGGPTLQLLELQPNLPCWGPPKVEFKRNHVPKRSFFSTSPAVLLHAKS